jgi:hypothetical protein
MRVLRSRKEDKLEASSLDLCKALDIFAEEVSSRIGANGFRQLMWSLPHTA